MKKLLATIGLAALAVSAFSQVPEYYAQTLWSTNNASGAIASATASTCGLAVADVRHQDEVAFAIRSQGDTSVAAGKLVLQYSVDGSTWADTTGTDVHIKAITVTPATTAHTQITNLPTYGCGYMRIAYYTNDTGAAVTNLVIKYAIKTQAP